MKRDAEEGMKEVLERRREGLNAKKVSIEVLRDIATIRSEM